MKVAQLALYGGMLKSQKGIDMKCRPSPTSTRERGAEKFPSGLPTHFAALSIADSFEERLLLLMSTCIVQVPNHAVGELESRHWRSGTWSIH